MVGFGQGFGEVNVGHFYNFVCVSIFFRNFAVRTLVRSTPQNTDIVSKGNELKPRIGLFGRRNAGKSSLVNYLTGQSTAIVSDTPGTTTDPVRKSMEIGGIGPVVLVDTAGIDDQGDLGSQRVEKTIAALAEVDLALLLFTQWGEPEERIEHWCNQHGTPLLPIQTKADLSPQPRHDEALLMTVKDPSLRDTLIAHIRLKLPETAWRATSLLGDIVAAGDTVVLVTPIDSSAPEGRMILPQVQVLRDLMDLHAQALFCQPQELARTLASLRELPRLVVTDSQAFKSVAETVPDAVPLTSFSVVLARQKGLFDEYLRGTQTIGTLRDGDRVLLLESCTHNVTCEDIGRVKLPAALRRATGKDIQCDIIAGNTPLSAHRPPLADYRLVIQCGGCVITRQQVRARLLPALEAGLPVSNYGLALAWCTGIFHRATKIFKQ
ncbi:MAG: [Bacteroidales bacterium]|nr:[FeFe] hydrogenase H-cluster maturation GTPase HydF [Bacteroidales bacterium]